MTLHQPIKPRLAGEMLMIQMFLSYILVYACFMTGMQLSAWLFPVALAGSWVLYAGIPKDESGSFLRTFLSTLLLWAGAMLAGSLLTDYSYDGNGYHQEVVAALCDGWREGEKEVCGIEMSIWSLHYAKGIEMMEAAVVTFTGDLESGKSVNFIMGFMTFFLVYSFVRNMLANISKKKAVVCALVATCNPIYISQLGTFYIDYAKYFYTLISIIYLFDIYRHPEKAMGYLMLGTVICLAAVSKFNAFFDEGVVVIAGMLWIWWRNHKTGLTFKIGLCGIVSALAGAIVLGYHPYITNCLNAGHPLYPLMGEGSIDIMTGNTPAECLAHGRIVNFFQSLITVSIPKADGRLGGFGPLMVVMLIISVIEIWRHRRVGNGVIVYLSIWVIASCFFFEQSWWARYIPQLWLLVAAGTILLLNEGTTSKMLLWIQLGCIAATTTISIGSGLTRNVRAALYRKAVMRELDGQEVEVTALRTSYRRQMREMGVTAIPASSDIAGKTSVPYYGLITNPEIYPMILTDSVTRDKILKRIECLPFDYSKQFNPNLEEKW